MSVKDIVDVRDKMLTELHELEAKLGTVHKIVNKLTIPDVEIPGRSRAVEELIDSTNMVKGLMESIDVMLTPKPNGKQRKV